MGVLSNAWRHIRRSPYQAFAAVSIMTLTFLVSGLFFILSVGSTVILRYFEQKPQIIVFFKDTKKEVDIKTLADRLKTMEKIASIKYVSKEEALDIYKEQFKKDPLLLEMVSAEILPASIEVSAIEIEYLPEIVNELRQESDIQEIVFPEDVVDLLVSWTTVFRSIGIGLVIFVGLVSLFNVMTVIGMKIALKREEIEILQLVGATHWYIRLPFIYEGIIYGIFGAMMSWLTIVGLLIYGTPSLTTLFEGIPLFPIPQLFYLFFLVFMVVAGCMLGILASTLAINRYLK